MELRDQREYYEKHLKDSEEVENAFCDAIKDLQKQLQVDDLWLQA
jgi:hypothetical protein